MDGKGIIHDNLERKILILYILRRLPCEVDASVLFDLFNNIDSIDYFTFTQCFAELASTELCKDDDGYFSITPKGVKNIANVETCLPYSVRLRADDAVESAAEALRRFSLIKTGYSQYDQGWKVSLSLDDGMGEILSIQLLCADKADAIKIRTNFRDKAEKYYDKIIDILTE